MDRRPHPPSAAIGAPSRALGEFPFVAKQYPEKVVAPLGGCIGPDDFEATADRVIAFAGAKAALPAQALLFDAGRFGLRSNMFCVTRAVGLTESVAAGDKGHRFFVIHCHTGKDLADIPRRSDRIRVAVRAFRVDINQSHLHSGEWILEVTVAGIALVTQPLSSEPQ